MYLNNKKIQTFTITITTILNPYSNLCPIFLRQSFDKNSIYIWFHYFM